MRTEPCGCVFDDYVAMGESCVEVVQNCEAHQPRPRFALSTARLEQATQGLNYHLSVNVHRTKNLPQYEGMALVSHDDGSIANYMADSDTLAGCLAALADTIDRRDDS